MGAPFIDLAHAVRETHTIGLQVLARLTGVAGDAELEDMRANAARLIEAAELLVELAPHEVLIRSITRVGGLADLPEYSPDISQVRVGVNALWLGEVRDVHPTECEVTFEALRKRTRIWVSRAKCVGIERVAPSMWLRAPVPNP
jgi:hypothetical protein